ncbi:uncharacterized protein PRCAT00000210001 [Priceomyces carsonii]|uniref:uncharacterized protein n=1 Tax=Priceomyces carsonii TaxID=28549 RepID=UPI002ED87950|nr:unnamed protein product [Priceomyces carsonii]
MSSFGTSSPSEASKVSSREVDDSRKKFSLSEAYGNTFNSSVSPSFDFGGRSYVSMGQRLAQYHSPTVYSGYDVHEQTATLAGIGVTDDTQGQSNDYLQPESTDISSSPPIPITSDDFYVGKTYEVPFHDHLVETSEDTPLIKDLTKGYSGYGESSIPIMFDNDLEVGEIAFHHSKDSPDDNSGLVHKFIVKPLKYIPAVFLGTLLNILDGLSYGMIMFPTSEAIFSSLGPAGLSMFYMSTIVSQLVYSMGGSALKSGIGSEMIEVTPFFHTMAISIASEMKQSGSDAIIATTILTYSISAVVTGLVFFLLGKMKLGILVGFFPRHILVGCIGGVGYFLIATGIEVSSRLEGGLTYSLPVLEFLFLSTTTLLEWNIPLLLAIILVVLQHKFHNSLLVPLYFVGVFLLFHLIVYLVPSWDLNIARDNGWVFPTVEDDQPWYGFYDLYKFRLVDWFCILKQTPTMLALTFFGILHVPINVPALAATIDMDQVDVDRELVAHGYSNVLSGLVGSIQNYLVYTNSVLFIRAGADSRLAGILLAIATAGVMFAGPVVIGYIPISVVGSLIYLLGYELLKEALYDTYGRLKKIEYSTIIIIIVTMGAFDFVIGIFVGILLACLSFVVDAARRPVVKDIYTGSVARSTVLRHPKQQEFLKDVGAQICVTKLQGTLFFGSIGGVETDIRSKFENDNFDKNPIKFLILDMKGVESIDFSAAEGFRRILNLLNEFKTHLIISSVFEDDDIIKALRDAGLWDNGRDIKLFNTLNYALEWCENSFLATYSKLRKENKILVNSGNTSLTQPASKPNFKLIMNQTFGTPRTTQIYHAAAKTVKDEQRIQNQYYTNSDSSFKRQPLPLIMITFSGLSKRDEKFWSGITKFFVKEKIPEDFEFYNSSKNAPSFFIVESGLVKSNLKFENNKAITSSILPMTAFGDLVQNDHQKNICYRTVNPSVVWKLSQPKLGELLETPEGITLYRELLEIDIKLLRERLDVLTSNLVISA